MLASDIPVRLNGQGEISRVNASWFNIIRTFLLDAFPGSVGETIFTINNNDTQDIAGLIFNSIEITSAKIRVSSLRSDASPSVRSSFTQLVCVYHPINGWSLDYEHNGDFPGVSYTIHTTTGQVSYTSSDMAGGMYLGSGAWKVLDTSALGI